MLYVSGRGRSNLPAELTSFVGRRRELAEALRLLSGARLLTLTGPGGVGKTRLALRLAADRQRAFPDGVWIAELADLDDPSLVADAVAEAMGLQRLSGRWTAATLAAHLAPRRILLVLDNCEHLVDACARLVDTLLRAGPGLRVIATSRHLLGVAGERVLGVPPLRVPPVPAPGADQSALAGGLVQYEAVSLLAERAAAVLGEFSLDEGNWRTVALLCHRLDGIPLAIELAAAWLRTLSLEQILDRLDNRYSLLTRGNRVGPRRQQTLRALIDWSFGLCNPDEQQMWACLSVFADGFTLEAAEQVGGARCPPAVVLDVLSGLVDKSILVRDDDEGTVRFRMLDTIRQYGQDRLRESGREQDVRRRHLAYYRRMAALADAQWCSPAQLDWIRRIRSEQANLRVALDFCLTTPGLAETALSIMVALWQYWAAIGLLSEARFWFDRGLSKATEPDGIRAIGLQSAAHAASLQGDITAAASLLAEARDLAARLHDQRVLARIACVEGRLAAISGDRPAAVERSQDARRRFADLDEPFGLAQSLLYLGLAHGIREEQDAAAIVFAECVALTERFGEYCFRSFALCGLGLAAWQLGELEQAMEHHAAAISLKYAFHDHAGIAVALEQQAWVMASAGRHHESAVLLGAAGRIWRETGASIAAFGLAPFHHRCEASLRRVLGQRKLERALAQGAELDLDEAVAAATQGTGTPVAHPVVPAGEPEVPLTLRERQVADLVARGLSNKEIASYLVIAQRTAEGHVERILGKLGFTSRAQIIAWVKDSSRSLQERTCEPQRHVGERERIAPTPPPHPHGDSVGGDSVGVQPHG